MKSWYSARVESIGDGLPVGVDDPQVAVVVLPGAVGADQAHEQQGKSPKRAASSAHRCIEEP